jgi:hypothetical protein
VLCVVGTASCLAVGHLVQALLLARIPHPDGPTDTTHAGMPGLFVAGGGCFFLSLGTCAMHVMS